LQAILVTGSIVSIH